MRSFATPPRPISAAPAEPRPKYLSRAIDLRRALCQGLQVKRLRRIGLKPNDSDGEWRGPDSDDDAEAPATAAPPEAPKRPVEVASESLPMAQRKPKRKKSSNSSADGAAGD